MAAARSPSTPPVARLTLIQRVVGFSGAVVLIALLASIAAVVSQQMVSNATTVAKNLSDLHAAVAATTRGLGEVILSEGSKSSRELLTKGIDGADTGFKEVAQTTPEVGKLSQSWGTIKGGLQKLLSNKKVGPDDEATLIAYGALQESLNGINSEVEAQEKLATDRATQLTERAFSLMMGSLILITILASLTGVFVVRAIQNRVGGDPRAVVRAVRAVVAGDLTTDLPVRGSDKTSIVAEMQVMQTSLISMVDAIRFQADELATVAERMGGSTLDLHDRTVETADMLDRSALATHQLTQTASHTADMAHQANQLSATASQLADQGGKVVSRVVETMQEINDSSKKIGDIIAVIDGIAFQTNILALNAAVEAARAGEQGRGFAVVASEVRSLAQRSAEAAREIKTLIVHSMQSVEAGKDQVQHAGSTMTDIVTGVQGVSTLIAQISDAASHQRDALTQLSSTIAEVDHKTRQNVQVVDDSTAASKRLQEQAVTMVSVVSRFKT